MKDMCVCIRVLPHTQTRGMGCYGGHLEQLIWLYQEVDNKSNHGYFRSAMRIDISELNDIV